MKKKIIFKFKRLKKQPKNKTYLLKRCPQRKVTFSSPKIVNIFLFKKFKFSKLNFVANLDTALLQIFTVFHLKGVLSPIVVTYLPFFIKTKCG